MLEIVRATSIIAALSQRSPNNGKTPGSLHVEVFGNCSIVRSQINKPQ